MQHIQSIIFPKNKFSVAQAIEWLKGHQYHHHKVDETAHFYRFRQMSPIHSGRYITKKLPNGVELVIHYNDKV